MAWRDDSRQNEALMAFLLTLGVCANLLEFLLPAPPFLPWLKPGFANAFTMAAIVFGGPVAGVQLALLRSLIAAAMSGLPLTSLCLSGAGGLVSAAVMGSLWQALGKRGWLSLLGLGMAGAFTHTLTQLGVIYLLFVKNGYVFWQLPVLGPMAVVTGSLTGLLAHATVRFIRTHENALNNESPPIIPAGHAGRSLAKLGFLFLLSIAIFLIHGLVWQAVMAPLLLVLLGTRRRRMVAVLLRFLPLLLLTFLINAFTEPGRLVPLFPWVTFDGLEKGAFLLLRLVNLIALSLNLFQLDDLTALLGFAEKRFPASGPWARVAIRGIAGIPATTTAFHDALKDAPEGLGKRVRHVWTVFPGTLEKLLKTI